MPPKNTPHKVAVSVGIACALAALHLGLHPDLPWLADKPEELRACELTDDINGSGIDGSGIDGSGVDAQVSLLPTISTREALELVGADGVTFVDVRDRESFREGHIPGALCLSAAQAPSLIGQTSLPVATGDRIITYCGADPSDAEDVGLLLRDSLQCEDVKVLLGGWPQWLAAAGPSAQEPGHG